MKIDAENSGYYRYLLNAEPVPIAEDWRRQPLAAGKWHYTSTRRAADVELNVDATLVAGGVEHCSLHWRSECAEVRADYRVLADCIEVRRHRADEPATIQHVTAAGAESLPIVSPLLRIFAGPAIAQLLHRGGRGQVLVPSIATPEQPETLLLPKMSDRSARVLDPSEILSVDGLEVPCRRCEYTGDQYGPGTEFWLDEHDVLRRYRWQQSPQQAWDVWLHCSEGDQR